MSKIFHSIPTASFLVIISILTISSAAAAQADDRDIVQLKSGGVVDGAIVSETADAVTVEISPGARAEIARSEIASIQRAAKKPESAPASRPASSNIPFSETWWIVRGARGETLGTRQCISRRDRERPELSTLEEKIEIKDDDGRGIIINRMEVFDASLNPVESYYHEVFEGGSSTVIAKVADSMLELETIDTAGRAHETLPFRAGMTFPMLFDAKVAAAKLAPGAKMESEVFDPMARNIMKRTVRAELPRSISLENETPTTHDVLVYKSRNRESLCWLSRTGDVARIELNGPELVAVRSTQKLALASRGAALDAGFLARDASGKIRLLLPNADWEVEHIAEDAISLTRRNGVANASVCAATLEDGATLAGVATDFERQLRMTLPEFRRTDAFEDFKIGGMPAMRFSFQFENDSIALRGIGAISIIKGRACRWTFSCKPKEYDQLVQEFERLIQRADVAF
ncbi:MAG: hypothetical protein HY286_09670 [Planctomycetes bacterium]|nr:hypothetical protein [Planctomycetota bacterium]